MMQPQAELALRQMLQYAREIQSLSQSKERADLDSDRLLELGLTRLLEIIGEAANRVSPEVQARYTTIPWAQMVSLRNRLIHGYDSVDLDILWQIIRHDLPPLITELEQIITD